MTTLPELNSSSVVSTTRPAMLPLSSNTLKALNRFAVTATSPRHRLAGIFRRLRSCLDCVMSPTTTSRGLLAARGGRRRSELQFLQLHPVDLLDDLRIRARRRCEAWPRYGRRSLHVRVEVHVVVGGLYRQDELIEPARFASRHAVLGFGVNRHAELQERADGGLLQLRPLVAASVPEESGFVVHEANGFAKQLWLRGGGVFGVDQER